MWIIRSIFSQLISRPLCSLLRSMHVPWVFVSVLRSGAWRFIRMLVPRRFWLYFLPLVLSLAIFGIDPVEAQTPTSTGVPATSTPYSLFSTPTRSPTENFDCPSTLPQGYRTVQPSLKWNLECGNCIPGLLPTGTPVPYSMYGTCDDLGKPSSCKDIVVDGYSTCECNGGQSGDHEQPTAEPTIQLTPGQRYYYSSYDAGNFISDLTSNSSGLIPYVDTCPVGAAIAQVYEISLTSGGDNSYSLKAGYYDQNNSWNGLNVSNNLTDGFGACQSLDGNMDGCTYVMHNTFNRWGYGGGSSTDKWFGSGNWKYLKSYLVEVSNLAPSDTSRVETKKYGYVCDTTKSKPDPTKGFYLGAGWIIGVDHTQTEYNAYAWSSPVETMEHDVYGWLYTPLDRTYMGDVDIRDGYNTYNYVVGSVCTQVSRTKYEGWGSPGGLGLVLNDSTICSLFPSDARYAVSQDRLLAGGTHGFGGVYQWSTGDHYFHWLAQPIYYDTPPVEPTEEPGYCDVVEPMEEYDPGSPGFNLGIALPNPVVTDRKCFPFGGQQFDSSFLDAFSWLTGWEPGTIQVPGVMVCMSTIELGTIPIFGRVFDLDILAMSLVGIAALRIAMRR